jgi:hypothetical protein
MYTIYINIYTHTHARTHAHTHTLRRSVHLVKHKARRLPDKWPGVSYFAKQREQESDAREREGGAHVSDVLQQIDVGNAGDMRRKVCVCVCVCVCV